MIIKNSNLRRDLFENRYKILAIIVAIILILFLIRIFNNFAIELNTKQNSSTNTTVVTSNYKPQTTTVLGSNVSEEKQNDINKVMDEFIAYCNSKEIEKAYNILTDECKEEIFEGSIQNFKKNYVEKIFNTYKTYNMQSWINAGNPTYKVKILNDVLATGKTGDIYEDYVTIVKQNNTYKINLNSYIGRATLNSRYTKNGVTMTITSIDTYKDYQTYNIKVENKTQNTILLDTKKNPKSVYITGTNGVTYSAFMYEIDDVYLTIKPRVIL